MNLFRTFGKADVAEHCAALLRKTRHIEHADTAAFQMRGHAQNTANGDNAGAAYPGDDDVVGLVDSRHFRLRQRWQIVIGSNARAFFQFGAVHGDEGGTESFDAGKILVATRLIDGALAAPLGFQRLYRDAVRLHAAVAAAFADQLVDDDALFRIGV